MAGTVVTVHRRVGFTPMRTPYGFSPLLKKIPEISWLFPNFGCGYHYNFVLLKFSLHPLTALLGHKNIFSPFDLIKEGFKYPNWNNF